MKLYVYLTEDGEKRLAKGEDPCYSWYFKVTPEESVKRVPLAEVEITLPSRESIIPVVVKALESKIQDIYTEAAKEAQEVREELQNLLAIEHSTEEAV